jgi:M6 family metalloprotease-like protein
MKETGRRQGWLVAAFAAALLAGPAQADAANCALSGSGLEGATDTSFYQVPDSTLEASMLFVDFPGDPAVAGETPPNTTIGPQLRTWAAGWFNDVSYGDMTLDLKFDTQWRTMSQPASQYTFTTFAGQRAFMAEAATLADGAGFDFSGRRTLYVVAAPTNGDLSNSPAFIAFENEAIVKDGTSIRWGSGMGDDAHTATNNYGSHILAHETGHTFGLPDLYSYDGNSFATTHLNAGAWDLMGWIGPGLGFNAWHRQKLGWLDPSQAICVDGEATATLSPLSAVGGTKMLVSKTTPSTAYVAEVRAPSGNDAGMCDPGGVLIYKVDANAASGASVDVGPIFVELADPNAPGDPNDANCGALSNAPFGFGAGQVSSFSEGPVTVQVLGGTPAGGFQVRMTGPANTTPGPGPGPDPGPDPDPDPNPTPSPALKTGDIERKLHLDGKKRVVASLTCPPEASSCTGTLTLALPGGKKLATREYAVSSPGGDVALSLDRKARKALSEAFGKKHRTKATATLDGAGGEVTQKVKLLR